MMTRSRASTHTRWVAKQHGWVALCGWPLCGLAVSVPRCSSSSSSSSSRRHSPGLHSPGVHSPGVQWRRVQWRRASPLHVLSRDADWPAPHHALPAPPALQPSSFAEEDEDESDFVNCRPLVPLVPSAAAGDAQQHAAAPAPAQDGQQEKHCGILYGNESLFVLLRLHQYVYERMKAARTCALQVSCWLSGGWGGRQRRRGWESSRQGVH